MSAHYTGCGLRVVAEDGRVRATLLGRGEYGRNRPRGITVSEDVQLPDELQDALLDWLADAGDDIEERVEAEAMRAYMHAIDRKEEI